MEASIIRELEVVVISQIASLSRLANLIAELDWYLSPQLSEP